MRASLAQTLLLILALGSASCHRARRTVPEVLLPDGDFLGGTSFDAIDRGGRSVDLVGINFSGKTISNIGINGNGGLNIDGYPGASNGGTIISIPNQVKGAFYVQVDWISDSWDEGRIDDEGRQYEAHHFVFKSILVKSRGPIPPAPKLILLVFYPNDRVECELLSELTSDVKRFDELRAQEGVK